MGHQLLRPGGAERFPTAAQERYPRSYIAIFDLAPTAIDRSLRAVVGETLLGRQCNQLVHPPGGDRIVSGERKREGAERQARSQRSWMSQAPSLGDCCAASYQCLMGKAETE